MQEIKNRFSYPYKKTVSKFIANPDRTVEWLGSVSYSNLEEILMKLKMLLSVDKDEEVTMLVSSYGGPSGVAMSFYDAVRSWLKTNLTTIGSGDVDSSGVLLFLAGKKRYLTKNTSLLLHLAGRTFEGGKRFTAQEMESMLKEDKLKDYQYACIVADATEGKYTPDKILELMNTNTILTAEEAVNMGLAHKVI